MPKKPKAKKPKAAPKFISTKKIPAKENIFDIRLKSLERKFVKLRKKLQDKGKVVFELDEAEIESVFYGLKYAKKAKRLEEKTQHLLKDSRLQEDEQTKVFIQFQWAKKAIPKTGAKEKDFRKCAKRLGWRSSKPGKRPTYDPSAIKDFWEVLKKQSSHQTPEERWALIEKVKKQFSFPTTAAAYQYLKETLKIKRLPWQGLPIRR